MIADGLRLLRTDFDANGRIGECVWNRFLEKKLKYLKEVP